MLYRTSLQLCWEIVEACSSEVLLQNKKWVTGNFQVNFLLHELKKQKGKQLWSRDQIGSIVREIHTLQSELITTPQQTWVSWKVPQTKLQYLMLIQAAFSTGFGIFFQNTYPLNGSRAWDWTLDVPVKPVLLAIDTYDDCCS